MGLLPQLLRVLALRACPPHARARTSMRERAHDTCTPQTDEASEPSNVAERLQAVHQRMQDTAQPPGGQAAMMDADRAALDGHLQHFTPEIILQVRPCLCAPAQQPEPCSLAEER